MKPLDDVLQEKLVALESGVPLEEVLAELSPDDNQELQALLGMAAEIRQLPHPAPELRPVQLTQAIAARKNGRPLMPRLSWPQLFTSPRLAVGAVVMFAAIVLLAGMGFWLAGPPAARAAVLEDVQGIVEIAPADDGAWTQAAAGMKVTQGQRIRTRADGQVTLAFFEGSQAVLSPQTDIALSQLAGNWGKVLQVTLDQNQGTSSHKVVPLQGKEASYRVSTPSGEIQVRGTVFQVAVDEMGKTQVSVSRGKVQVANPFSSVTLTAGQLAEATPDEEIQPPAYAFKLKGELTSMEASQWMVNGVAFQVNANTKIQGNPQVGSWVLVQGSAPESGDWLANHAVVISSQRTSSSFSGILQSMEGDLWQVGGRDVLLNAATQLEGELTLGLPVRVTFVVQDDGRWLAISIAALDEEEPEPEETPEVTLPVVTETITATEVISATPTLSATLVTDCTGANPHPQAVTLGQAFGVPDSEIMGWFCQGYGFGEIEQAYSLSQEYGVPADEIFSMRGSGLGWGAIKKQVPLLATPQPEPGAEGTPEPPSEEQGCTAPGNSSKAPQLAAKYGVSEMEIMNWYCQGWTFADIDKAYGLSRESGTPVDEIFAMRASGMSWGKIQAQLKPKKPTKTKRPK